MSTRSRIAVEDEETGTVRSIYCHSDGYPKGVGQTLIDHYRDREKVEALIDLGDLSCLEAEVAPPEGVQHCFREGGPESPGPFPGVCVAYGRDRGNPDCGAVTDESADALYSSVVESWCEWAYLYRQGVWFVTEVGGGAGAGLVDANDPDGTAPANWRNLEGVLTFVEPKKPSYALDAAQLPVFDGKAIPGFVITPIAPNG